ncbi:MAG: TatD DNase family protein [Bacteroidia bacterium]
MITDSHTHLYWKSFDEDRAEVLERARAAGIERMIVVGTDLDTSRAALALAHQEHGIFASVGIHPNDLGGPEGPGPSPETLASIAELARDPKCVAIGETGLDFYWDSVARERQIEGFRWHLELSSATGKPVIIHSRDAHEETVRVLTEDLAPTGPGGVMHCFTMGAEELTAYAKLDLYISFSGVVTFKKNDANREAAKATRDERLLVETDCPFLAPQHKRGKRNEPSFVTGVIECVAQQRGMTTDAVEELTTNNAARLFGLTD